MRKADTKRCVILVRELLFCRSGKLDIAMDEAGTFFFTAMLIRETTGRRTLNLEMGAGWTVKKANFDLEQVKDFNDVFTWIRRTGNRLTAN